MTIFGYQYLQMLSLLLALVCVTGLRQYSIAAFIPLLIITNVVEIIGNNYNWFGWENNYFIYNMYLIFSTPFTLHIYSRMLQLSGYTLRIFHSISLFCMILILVNCFLLQRVDVFSTEALVLIMILNIIFSCLVLFRLSSYDFTEPNLFREPYFWINAVTLLFSMVTLVLLGLQHYIQSNSIVIGNKNLYAAIMPPANMILYAVYSYTFLLCQIRTTRRS